MDKEIIKVTLDGGVWFWIDKKEWDFEQEYGKQLQKEWEEEFFKNLYMKQKLILHEIPMDRDMYFDSYEEMAKHLDVKASKLKRITNTGEVINYIYTIKTK